MRVVLKDDEIPKRDRLGYLRQAKPLGYALLQRNRKLEEAERRSIELEVEQTMREAAAEAKAEAAKKAAEEKKAREMEAARAAARAAYSKAQQEEAAAAAAEEPAATEPVANLRGGDEVAQE